MIVTWSVYGGGMGEGGEEEEEKQRKYKMESRGKNIKKGTINEEMKMREGRKRVKRCQGSVE